MYHGSEDRASVERAAVAPGVTPAALPVTPTWWLGGRSGLVPAGDGTTREQRRSRRATLHPDLGSAAPRSRRFQAHRIACHRFRMGGARSTDARKPLSLTWDGGNTKPVRVGTSCGCIATTGDRLEAEAECSRRIRFSGADTRRVVLSIRPVCSVGPRLVRAARVDAVTRLFPQEAGATEMSSSAERIPDRRKGATRR